MYMDSSIAKLVADGAVIHVDMSAYHLEDAEKMIKEEDENGDGVISYDEYPKPQPPPKPITYVELSSANNYTTHPAAVKKEEL